VPFPVAFVERFKREYRAVGAVVAITFLVVTEKCAIKILLFTTLGIYSSIGRDKGGDTSIFTRLELAAIGSS
jgi:hypothetical protein